MPTNKPSIANKCLLHAIDTLHAACERLARLDIDISGIAIHRNAGGIIWIEEPNHCQIALFGNIAHHTSPETCECHTTALFEGIEVAWSPNIDIPGYDDDINWEELS